MQKSKTIAHKIENRKKVENVFVVIVAGGCDKENIEIGRERYIL